MSKIVNKNLCSNYSLNINESPIGSASNFDKYLLIGVPTPWKSEITESEKFPKKIKALLQENPNLLKSTKTEQTIQDESIRSAQPSPYKL